MSMTTVTDLMRSMDYGPAPEASTARCATGWTPRRRHSAISSTARFTDTGHSCSTAANPATGEVLARRRAGHGGGCGRGGGGGARRPTRLGGAGRARSARAISTPSPATSRSASASWRCWRRWTTASRSARRAISTCRWSRGISTTMPAGPNCCDSEFPGHAPVGVCGQIIPWNFPLLMLAWKIAPALAPGNTVVLKPAEYTPLTALVFAEICQRSRPARRAWSTSSPATAQPARPWSGIPTWTRSPSPVRPRWGASSAGQTAGTGKKLTLELGGKSPFVVFDDADLDAAVEGVVDAIWFNQGQVCCAGSRHSGAGRRGRAVRGQADGAAWQRCAWATRWTSPSTWAHRRSACRLTRITSTGRAGQGRRRRAALVAPVRAAGQGLLHRAGLLHRRRPGLDRGCEEEIFGPVATLMTFRTPDEAVRAGQQHALWPGRLDLVGEHQPGARIGARRSRRAWSGSIAPTCSTPAAGFGGYRESGFGREGGREGMYEYLAAKWPKSALKPGKQEPCAADAAPVAGTRRAGIDRTAKLYIGGKQARPDGGYSYAVHGRAGLIGAGRLGNRKDIRNAVEAARQGAGLGRGDRRITGRRCCIIVAENLDARRGEFARPAARVDRGLGRRRRQRRLTHRWRALFWYAAQADKFDGAVHATKSRACDAGDERTVRRHGHGLPRPVPLLGS